MKRFFVLFVLALSVWGCSAVSFAQEIRVGVVNTQRSAVVKVSAGTLTVEGAGDGYRNLPAGTNLLISASDGSLLINGSKAAGTALTLRPQGEAAELEVNKRSYRGYFTVSLLSGGKFLTVVNILPLEAYLYSTVGSAVPALWPEEAVKAQVLVNRSKAYQAIGSNSQKRYDIEAMSGQPYYGKQAEREDVNAIVDTTSGLVITYQGSVIDAPYHASSGGRTEAGSQSYLQSVLDHDQDSPNYEWEKIFSAEEINASLQYAGYDGIGSLRGFDFSPMNLSKLGSLADRGQSGRLKEVKIIGERGFEVIDGAKFAKILNLPSSAFDLAVDNIIPQSVDIPITDRYGNVIGYKKMPIEVKANVTFPPDRPSIQRVTWAENEKIIIKGRGQGSGLGLSQWGSRGLALAGKNYGEILHYYFPGTAVKKVY